MTTCSYLVVDDAAFIGDIAPLAWLVALGADAVATELAGVSVAA